MLITTILHDTRPACLRWAALMPFSDLAVYMRKLEAVSYHGKRLESCVIACVALGTEVNVTLLGRLKNIVKL